MNYKLDHFENFDFISVNKMNYITAFDIRLDKDIYYSGENISGNVILENSRNIRIKGLNHPD